MLTLTGVVKFHETSISEIESESRADNSPEDPLTESGSLLEHYIQSVRESLGVELHATVSK